MNRGAGYEWVTHEPLIRAVMDLYKPKFILELGIGDNSTPVLLEYGIDYLGVDSDLDWFNYMKDKYNADFLFHYSETTVWMKYNDLTDKQKDDIVTFYKKIPIPEISPKLLFIDQYAACRVLSINALRENFDLIIFHDSENPKLNRWDLINKTGFTFYDLKTSGASTALMVKNDKGFEALYNAINNYIVRFLKDHKDCTLMQLINGLR
jgi:hypothetical protein